MRQQNHSTNPDHWHKCDVCQTIQPIVGQTGDTRIIVGCGHVQSTFLLVSPVPLRADSQTADFEQDAA